jgi:hypothetical protein
VYKSSQVSGIQWNTRSHNDTQFYSTKGMTIQRVPSFMDKHIKCDFIAVCFSLEGFIVRYCYRDLKQLQPC